MRSANELPYIILEVANSHGGEFGKLEELVSSFSMVDYPRKGIKFQIFSPNGIALPDFEWFSVYEDLFFDSSTWRDLIGRSFNYGDVWVDVFDVYGVEVISQNIEKIHGIKLQASVLENYEVRDRLALLDLSHKNVMVNVSGLDLSLIQGVCSDFERICKNLIIQIGYQSYPTKVEDTGLQKIAVLKSAFPNIPLCMADHADAEGGFAVNVPVYAALLGCDYVEKHFCLDRKTAKYDGYSALEMHQLKDMCSALKDTFSAKSGDFLCDAEREYLRKTIQVPVLKNNVAAGELISFADLVYRRTSQKGIGAREIFELQRSRSVLLNNKISGSTVEASDFRSARIAVVVAGRMKSSRLPAKAILPIAGVPSIERCLAQCLSINGVDRVILATSNLEEDSVLSSHTLKGRVDFWAGDADDVISRYLGACDHYGIDVVVRITADCPLVLPEIIEYLIDKHFESGADYTAAESCAVGSSGEIINVSALRKVINYFGVAEHSEYMTWYFRNNSEYFKINIVSLPSGWIRDYRMTLDYPEDLRMFEELYSALEKGKGHYSMEEVFNVLDKKLGIAAINNGLPLKYATDQSLIDMLNLKTKMTSSK